MTTRTMLGTTVRFGAGTLLALATAGSAAAQVTTRVSVDSAAAEANDDSSKPSISGDGRYVAFASYAANLVAVDVNGIDDVFVHDRQTGATELVSVDSAGGQGDDASSAPAISADGRFVAFVSGATNLVPGDTNDAYDIFVHDRQTGTTERVSVHSSGAEGDDNSPGVAGISGDGRFVAFSSSATNLVAGDTNGVADVFVHDRQTATTERVSVSSVEAQTNGHSFFPSISADGRYVAFLSEATNLVAGDTNLARDIFVRDRQLGTTARVSVGAAGAQGNGGSEGPSISGDGRYVAFRSAATNLVAGDTNGALDVFVRDIQTGTTERVSVTSAGAQATGVSAGYPSISADGRCVAFGSVATNLVAGDTNGVADVFLRDRQLGTTERVSVDSSGAQGNGTSQPGGEPNAISADGRFVAFESVATNLVAGDTNGFDDVFVRDRGGETMTFLCDPGVDGVIACPCSNPPAGNGRGCDNFGTGPVDSGTLTATGVPSLSSDSVVLHATGENSTSFTVFWTGTTQISPPGVAHGAGVRCVSGLKRLYTGAASGGAISRPAGADPSVSARSAAVGAPIVAGDTRYYFTVYRDPSAAGPCGNSASTINLTNAGAILWSL